MRRPRSRRSAHPVGCFLPGNDSDLNVDCRRQRIAHEFPERYQRGGLQGELNPGPPASLGSTVSSAIVLVRSSVPGARLVMVALLVSAKSTLTGRPAGPDGAVSAGSGSASGLPVTVNRVA